MRAVYSVPDLGSGDGLLLGFVAANLDGLLRKRGLSQRDFAKKVGASESAVSGWLAAKQLPRDRHWKKILEVLDCSLEDLTRDPKADRETDPVIRYLRAQAKQFGYELTKI